MNTINAVTFATQAFVTLFVIMDPPGATPIFLGLVGDKSPKERIRLAWQAAGVSLFVLRPIALKHLKKRPADFATNVDALIGAPAVALTEVTVHDGQVKLSGEIWSARSQGALIDKDSMLEVVAIEGATAIVKVKG